MVLSKHSINVSAMGVLGTVPSMPCPALGSQGRACGRHAGSRGGRPSRRLGPAGGQCAPSAGVGLLPQHHHEDAQPPPGSLAPSKEECHDDMKKIVIMLCVPYPLPQTHENYRKRNTIQSRKSQEKLLN